MQKLDPAWQDCEDYFRKKYRSCLKCQAGHKMPFNLRRHITTIHETEMALGLFGKDAKCSICKKVSVPLDGKKFMRKHMIKMHMAIHLELFIQDVEARRLLLKAKESKKKVSGAKRDKA